MPSFIDLKRQAAELLEKAEQMRREELPGVISDMQQRIAEYGITQAELFPTASKKTLPPSGKVYRHPTDSKKTWLGRGHTPMWLKELTADGGKSIDDFLVKN